MAVAGTLFGWHVDGLSRQQDPDLGGPIRTIRRTDRRSGGGNRRQPPLYSEASGSVAERFKALVLKTSDGATRP